ncbi:MAG TPA: methyltransferase domain-containing protein [Ktedonobacteraceae bacterium]|nr:methyltransferase domain-containing protein [Ktedonobacteraceae bacterium]
MSTPVDYYVMTMPGLETVAFSEIRERVPDAELVKFSRGVAQFRSAEPPAGLLALRAVEDVFITLAYISGLGHRRDALRVLHSATLHSNLEHTLALWRRAHHGRRPATWRVVSQKQGAHEFRRVDAGNTVIDALKEALPRGIHPVKDEADIEFWLWLNGGEALLGLRLSDATMRHRTYKQEHLPASLRPTVAAAMSLLSRPTAEDIVLDPLCGAGTLLIERALLAPVREELGGDIRKEAVTMARRNAQAAGIRAHWRVWDARELPLEAGSVTRILTNLPFGKQIGTHEANTRLYAKLALGFRRVLAEDGILVTLTSEDRLWEAVLRDSGWRISKKVVLVILGQPASIFVAARA